MVPSGPMVAEAPLPTPSCPRVGGPATGAVTSGVGPRFCPKSNVHFVVPSLAPAAGGARAYSLPSRLVRYTVPSAASAGATFTAGPACADHFTLPSGATTDRRPPPETA